MISGDASEPGDGSMSSKRSTGAQRDDTGDTLADDTDDGDDDDGSEGGTDLQQ